jgi:hypothetical protein
MKKIILPLCLLLIAVAAFGQPRKPNLVLVLIDDYGWADTGCYGSTWHRTPNIDALAARGMRFTDAYAAAPVCSPTRAALMTGKHPARLHLTDWLPGRDDKPNQKMSRPSIRQALPLEETSLAEPKLPTDQITSVTRRKFLRLISMCRPSRSSLIMGRYPNNRPRN